MRPNITLPALVLALLATVRETLPAQSCPFQNVPQCLSVEALDQGGLKLAIQVTAQANITVTGFSIPCYRIYGPLTSLPAYLLRGAPGAPTLGAAAATGSLPIYPGSQSSPWQNVTLSPAVQVSVGETFFLSFLLPDPGINPVTGIRLPIAGAPACSGSPLLATPGFALQTLLPPQYQAWTPFPYTVSNWMFQVACTITPAGVPPAIIAQPQSQAVVVGNTATFSVGASGTAPLSYQWRRNGVAISGANASSYSVTASPGLNGSLYSVVVSNAYGSVTSQNATLTVLSAPIITSQPQSVSVCAGTPVTLTVTATGTALLSYQWQSSQGVNIAGATAPTFTSNAIAPPANLSFRCLVSNAYGSVWSNWATVTGISPPIIVSVPQSPITVCAGDPVILNFTVGGAQPITFVWRKNGVVVSGATASSLNIPSASTADSGTYTLTATNSCGTVTSPSIVVSVVPPPVCDFTMSPSPACVLLPAQFQDISTTTAGTIVSRSWNINGEAAASGPSVSHVFGTPGSKSITLSIVTSIGCTASRTKFLQVNGGIPVVSAINASSRCGTAPLAATFSVTASPAPSAFAWDFDNDGVIDSTNANPVFTYNQLGVYPVTVTVSTCSGSAAPFTMPAFIEVRSPLAATMLEYQFNEVNPGGVQVANSGCPNSAPEQGTVSSAGWQSDPGPGRAAFKSPDPNAVNTGCLGRSALNRTVSTGWVVSLPASFTFMWWQRLGPAVPSSNNADRVYVFEADNNFRCYAGGGAGSGLSVSFGGSGGGGGGGGQELLSGDVLSNPGTWIHVAVVRDAVAGSTRFFLNGVPDAMNSVAAPGSVLTGSPLVINNRQGSGTWSFTRFFDLDDFRVYALALGQAQIQTAMLGENAAATRFGLASQGVANPPRIGTNGAPAIGNAAFALRLDNAQPGVPCLLAVGLSAASAGGIPLPIDLGPAGLPGTFVNVDPEIQLWLATGNGSLELPIPIVEPALQGLHVYAQFAVLGPSLLVTEGLDINIR